MKLRFCPLGLLVVCVFLSFPFLSLRRGASSPKGKFNYLLSSFFPKINYLLFPPVEWVLGHFCIFNKPIIHIPYYVHVHIPHTHVTYHIHI